MQHLTERLRSSEREGIEGVGKAARELEREHGRLAALREEADGLKEVQKNVFDCPRTHHVHLF